MKIAMIGVGAYSTALAMMLSKKENNEVLIHKYKKIKKIMK